MSLEDHVSAETDFSISAATWQSVLAQQFCMAQTDAATAKTQASELDWRTRDSTSSTIQTCGAFDHIMHRAGWAAWVQ